MSLCQHHSILITVALYQLLKSGCVSPPTLSLLFKMALALRTLVIPYEFKDPFNHFCKISFWDFDMGCIESAGSLDSIDVLIILTLLIQEYGGSFHFSESSSVSFINVL